VSIRTSFTLFNSIESIYLLSVLSFILHAPSSHQCALVLLSMPTKNNKGNGKGKGQGAGKKVGAPAADADDDLDDIIAEVLAGDMPQLTSDGGNLPAITAGSTLSSNAGPAGPRKTEVSVPEATIIDAVRRGDTAQLKRWGRQGVQVRSATPLFTAVGNRASNAVSKILVKDLGADVNQADERGLTPLMVATAMNRLHTMRCLGVDLGADVNLRGHNSYTPLMVASAAWHGHVVVWLLKNGADAHASSSTYLTAVDISRILHAPAKQTAYLEARMHCAKPGCGGAGLKKCAGCLKVYFCSPDCQVAYWPSHKAECKRIAAPSSSLSLSLSSSSSVSSS
jgi:hypothetical protein